MQLSSIYAGPGFSHNTPTDWWLPLLGWLKLNFDGAFNKFTHKARVGGVVRDQYGVLITAYSGDIRADHPVEAELIALQRGLIRYHDLQLSNVQVEGDCLALVTFIQHSGHLTWEMMGLWKRVMHLLAGIHNWTIHYCKLTANRLADLLEKLDAPIITHNVASLLFQARDAYIDERDRATAYTRAFFQVQAHDTASSTLPANHQSLKESPHFGRRLLERGSCSYTIHGHNG